MDETAVWLDMPGETTIETVGVKSVPLKTTGHEKERVTVCLTAMADGRKLPPLLIFKGKRMPNELKNVTGAVIELSPNGWMNEQVTGAWLTRVWGTLAFSRRFLVWDSFRCHASEKTKEAVKKTRTMMGVIPGGCTKLLQPADVSWNSPFKTAYRAAYDRWLATAQHTYTPA